MKDVIFHILNISTKEIDVPKLRKLCKRQYGRVDKSREQGYEILMPPTVHETYKHTTQKMEANGGHGLGKRIT